MEVKLTALFSPDQPSALHHSEKSGRIGRIHLIQFIDKQYLWVPFCYQVPQTCLRSR